MHVAENRGGRRAEGGVRCTEQGSTVQPNVPSLSQLSSLGHCHLVQQTAVHGGQCRRGTKGSLPLRTHIHERPGN